MVVKNEFQFNVWNAVVTLKSDQGQQNWVDHVKLYVNSHSATSEKRRW